MATVTGKTSAKIDELLGQAVVGGELNAEGVLIFTRKNGSTINAGSLGASFVNAVVNGAKHLILTKKDGSTVDAGSVATSVLEAWPVGSIYMSAVSTNPATLLGGGTWARWGQGRVPVSLQSTDPDFDTAEEIGGAKTATIDPHSHTMSHTHEHPHTHDLNSVNNGQLGGSSVRINSATTDGASEDTTSLPSVPNTGSAGGSTVPLLQPYITCYMWKRTA